MLKLEKKSLKGKKKSKSYAEVEILHQSFTDCLLSRPLRSSDDEELGLTNVRETMCEHEPCSKMNLLETEF